MKKFLKIISIFMVCAMLLPVFVACQKDVNTELKGIRFSQSLYEIDIDTPTSLSYSVFPSTATSSSVRFAFDGDESQDYENKYSFNTKTGKITIIEECGEIEVTIFSGDYSDKCTVKLKKYPTTLSFAKDTYLLNRGNALNLSLKGLIGGVETQIDANEYDIELVCSNQSVVRIGSDMNVFSTGKTGSATISAYIKNKSGKYVTEYENHYEDKKTKEGVLIAETTITIVDNIADAYLNIVGAETFMKLSNSSTRTTENTRLTVSNIVKFSFIFYSEDGYYINPDDVEILIVSNNPTVADMLANEDGYIKDNDNYQLKFKQNGEFVKIEVHTNLVDSNGNPIEYKFYIQKSV